MPALSRHEATAAFDLLERVWQSNQSPSVLFYRAMALQGLGLRNETRAQLELLAADPTQKYGRLAAEQLATETRSLQWIGNGPIACTAQLEESVDE